MVYRHREGAWELRFDTTDPEIAASTMEAVSERLTYGSISVFYPYAYGVILELHNVGTRSGYQILFLYFCGVVARVPGC
jgi:hypothetical protein